MAAHGKHKKAKRKMTPGELRRSKNLAEKMKGHPEIDNPHALARHQVKKQRRKR